MLDQISINFFTGEDQATKKPKKADDYEVYEEKTMKGNFKHLLERHECDRICKEEEEPKICHYELHVSEYTTMGKVNGTLQLRSRCLISLRHHCLFTMYIHRLVSIVLAKTKKPFQIVSDHNVFMEMGLEKE